MIDSAKHEQILGQLKLSMEIERGELLQKERMEHQKQLDELLAKFEADKLVSTNTPGSVRETTPR